MRRSFGIILSERGMDMFQNKVVVITGGANGIDKCIREEFEKAGAKVCVIDIADKPI